MPGQFDPQSLFDAIDAQRGERGMTWSDLSKELHISTTTMTSMTKRRFGLELDGVIGMCQWVGRSVESFAGGEDEVPATLLRPARSGYFLRFDKKAVHVAVDAERERRGLTWKQVASEVWPSWPGGAKRLQDMAKGGRGDVYAMLTVCRWVGRPIESFMYESMT